MRSRILVRRVRVMAAAVATGGVISAGTAAVMAAGLGGIAGDAVGRRVTDRFDGGG
jgi:hypothetical protein